MLTAAEAGAVPDHSTDTSGDGPTLDLTPRTEAVFERYTHAETGDRLADLDPERQALFPIRPADVVETIRPEDVDQFPLQKRHAELYHLGNLLSEPESSESVTARPLRLARALVALLTRSV